MLSENLGELPISMALGNTYKVYGALSYNQMTGNKMFFQNHLYGNNKLKQDIWLNMVFIL